METDHFEICLLSRQIPVGNRPDRIIRHAVFGAPGFSPGYHHWYRGTEAEIRGEAYHLRETAKKADAQVRRDLDERADLLEKRLKELKGELDPPLFWPKEAYSPGPWSWDERGPRTKSGKWDPRIVGRNRDTLFKVWQPTQPRERQVANMKRLAGMSHACEGIPTAVLFQGPVGWAGIMEDVVRHFRQVLLTHRAQLPSGAGDLYGGGCGCPQCKDMIEILKRLEGVADYRAQDREGTF